MSGSAPEPGKPRIEKLAANLRGLPEPELHARLREAIAPLSLAERFDLLHRLGVYHHSESLSGAASSLRETAALREALPAVVADCGVATLLDIPCGDFYWLSRLPLAVDYLGADVVPALVTANEERHGGPQRRFAVLDATRDPLPKVDLILCRDLLIHLSLGDGLAALRNFVASGSRWLLTNQFAERTENPDIVSGDFRPVNLCLEPFALPAPRRLIVERSELAGGAFADRAIGLWRLEDIAAALASPA